MGQSQNKLDESVKQAKLILRHHFDHFKSTENRNAIVWLRLAYEMDNKERHTLFWNQSEFIWSKDVKSIDDPHTFFHLLEHTDLLEWSQQLVSNDFCQKGRLEIQKFCKSWNLMIVFPDNN